MPSASSRSTQNLRTQKEHCLWSDAKLGYQSPYFLQGKGHVTKLMWKFLCALPRRAQRKRFDVTKKTHTSKYFQSEMKSFPLFFFQNLLYLQWIISAWNIFASLDTCLWSQNCTLCKRRIHIALPWLLTQSLPQWPRRQSGRRRKGIGPQRDHENPSESGQGICCLLLRTPMDTRSTSTRCIL